MSKLVDTVVTAIVVVVIVLTLSQILSLGSEGVEDNDRQRVDSVLEFVNDHPKLQERYLAYISDGHLTEQEYDDIVDLRIKLLKE